MSALRLVGRGFYSRLGHTKNLSTWHSTFRVELGGVLNHPMIPGHSRGRGQNAETNFTSLGIVTFRELFKLLSKTEQDSEQIEYRQREHELETGLEPNGNGQEVELTIRPGRTG